MPLRKTASKEDVSANISQLRKDGYPARQSVAIALDIQRQARAKKRARGGGVTTGFLAGDTKGRADDIQTAAPAGAYVIPADVVSALGEGNSAAGAQALQEMIARRAPGRAAGGDIPEGVTPVMLSDGEFVVLPEDVSKFGGGNHRAGIQWFDRWVVNERKKHIKKLRKLPGPVTAKG